MEETRKASYIEKLESRLKGSKFRVLNELMYKESGAAVSKELLKKYHEGFREQVKKWPFNPITQIIREVAKMDRTLKVVDLGCGDGLLAKAVPSMDIQSFDLLQSKINPKVIVCDIRHTSIDSASVDVVVFCLSLMTEDASSFIKEGVRVLREGGVIKIAEVRSRLGKIEDFLRPLKKYGLRLLKKDLASNYFAFFTLRKVESIDITRDKLPSLPLKACLYKKR